jgi:hypothetical protein
MRGNLVLSCGLVVWSCCTNQLCHIVTVIRTSTEQAIPVMSHGPCRPLSSFLGSREPAKGSRAMSRIDHPARFGTVLHLDPVVVSHVRSWNTNRRTLSYASKMSVKNWLPSALSSTEQSYGTSNLGHLVLSPTPHSSQPSRPT